MNKSFFKLLKYTTEYDYSGRNYSGSSGLAVVKPWEIPMAHYSGALQPAS
jgi:hypothetical protein